MRTVAPLVAAFLLGLTGCTPSSVDPDATVRITGRALDSDGRPLAGARVLLLKEVDLGELVFGSVLALGTLSTICLLPEPPGVCGKAHETTAGDDGRFRFELEGSDTQGTLGAESTLDLVVAHPESLTSTTLSFTAKGTAIRLPAARLWRSKVGVSRPGGDIRLSWSPLDDGGATYAAHLYDDGGAPLWIEPASGGEATIDPRLLEDEPGTVAVAAHAPIAGGRNAGELTAHYGSEQLPVRATAGAPPSRGSWCGPTTGKGRKTVRPTSPCAATDGDLAEPAEMSTSHGYMTGVVVDLGSARPVSMIVARGVVGEVVVEVSSDGTAYRPVATTTGPVIGVDVPGGTTARYVRLRSPAGVDQNRLSELSIW